MNKIMSMREVAQMFHCHAGTVKPLLEEFKIEPVRISSDNPHARKYYDSSHVMRHATEIQNRLDIKRGSREKNLVKGRAVLAAKREARANEEALLPLTTLIETVKRVEGKLDQLIEMFR